MEYIAKVVLLFSVAFSIGSAQNTFVEPDSVQCLSDGVYFVLDQNANESSLYAETQLQITLYTGYDDQLVTNFDPTTGDVNISYAQYSIVATTAYGSGQRPILYNIEQPFLAVPLAGGYNYTFSVYCTIPASYNVNVTTNTTDDDHGGDSGQIVNPQDHISTSLNGLRSDGSTTLGDPLTYVLETTDGTYAALLPVTCAYYNPSDDVENLPFVSDSCPRPFQDDPSGYFGTMQRVNATNYQLSFRAFSFESTLNSFLGIDCDILLCIDSNVNDCYKSCWGPEGSTPAAPPPPTVASSEASTPASSSALTSEASSSAASSSEASSSPASSSEASSSPASSSEASSSAASSSAASTSESSSAATTTPAPGPPGPPLRMRVRFMRNAVMRVGDASNDDDPPAPTSVTIDDKLLVKVNMPDAEPTDTQCQQTCSDSGLLTALYAVIGGLAVLIAVLVLTLVYLMCAGRHKKVDPYHQSMLITH